MHRAFPEDADDATICACFWAGIALGLLHFQASKDWAFAMIAAMDEPGIEIIDIATAHDRNRAMDAVQAAAEGADWQRAGRWLLVEVREQFQSGQRSALETSQIAMRVAETTQLPEEVCHAFDALDDELELLANGIYGTAAEVEADLLEALERHSFKARLRYE